MLKLFVFLVSAVSMTAFAQSETSKQMFFETPEACVSAKDGEFAIYLPHFIGNLSRWSKTDLVVDHNKTFCAEEWSLDDNLVKGWRIVRWPQNNSYFRRNDKLGDGRCGNSVRRLWEVPEQEISTPPPSPVPMPEPEVVLPPAQPSVELNDLPPAYWPETRHYVQVILDYEKRRKFPIPCWPREKGWYGTGIPILSCAAIAAGIVLPLVGGAEAVATVGHKIVPIGGVISPP